MNDEERKERVLTHVKKLDASSITRWELCWKLAVAELELQETEQELELLQSETEALKGEKDWNRTLMERN